MSIEARQYYASTVESIDTLSELVGGHACWEWLLTLCLSHTNDLANYITLQSANLASHTDLTLDVWRCQEHVWFSLCHVTFMYAYVALSFNIFQKKKKKAVAS